MLKWTMIKKTATKKIFNQSDTPWKKVLHQYFREFLKLCHPEIEVEIDWAKGVEFLDKELSRFAKRAEMGNRLVDKLAKVCRLNGDEAYILVHVEVTGEDKKDFSERMFTYYYRLYDHYKHPIISIGVLVDDNPDWLPAPYTQNLGGCQLYFDFFKVKALSFQPRKAELEASLNPFATVMLAQLSAIETKRDESSRYELKKSLTKMLYNKKLAKADILDLYSFIDWILGLPKSLEEKLITEIEEFEEEKKVAYITSAERIGIEKGMEKGIQKGEKLALFGLLKKKFGNIPAEYSARIEKANSQTLLSWIESVLHAKSLEEVFT